MRPADPAAPAWRGFAGERWLVELGHLARIDRLDRGAGREKLADGEELVAALLELRNQRPQRQPGRRCVGATLQVHDHDRPRFDFGEHRGDDLLRIAVEGVDGVDVPLDGNEPGSVDQVERLAVIAATGKPKVLRQYAWPSPDRLLPAFD